MGSPSIHWALFVGTLALLLSLQWAAGAPPVLPKFIRSLSKNRCGSSRNAVRQPMPSTSSFSSSSSSIPQHHGRQNSREPSRGREPSRHGGSGHSRSGSRGRSASAGSRDSRRSGSRSGHHRSGSRSGGSRSGSRSRGHQERKPSGSRAAAKGKSSSRAAARDGDKGKAKASSSGSGGQLCSSLPEYRSGIVCGDDKHKHGDKKGLGRVSQMLVFRGQKYTYCKDSEHFASGGQGKLYYAYSFKLKKCVGIKIVDLSALKSSSDHAGAMNEFDVVQHLIDNNKNREKKFTKIIELYENFKVDDNWIYTIMELGRYDLSYYVEEKVHKIKSNSEWLKAVDNVVFMMTNALVELHSAGVMHLDFKLKNAIVTKDAKGRNVVKLIDFGASRYTKANEDINDISRTVNISKKIFTAKYCAPELYKGDKVSIRSDIWSLGATMVDILTNKEVIANDILFLERDRDNKVQFHRAYSSRKYDSYKDYIRNATMPALNATLKDQKWVSSSTNALWLMALSCLRAHVKDRPLALQLVAYLNNWCILNTSSVYSCAKKQTYHPDKERRGMKYCNDFTDDDYWAEIDRLEESKSNSTT